MTFPYISVEEARARGGLRMVVIGNVPSPWGEAAKGILHIKGIAWAAVRLVYDDDSLKEWAGQRSGPVAIYDHEPPRAGWAEILLLAERLAPTPSLLPADPAERALMFGIGHEICGESGLGWSRRLQLIEARVHNAGGFPEQVARYLGKKYGYRPQSGAAATVAGGGAAWHAGSAPQVAARAGEPLLHRPLAERGSMSTARPSWRCSARCRPRSARCRTRPGRPSRRGMRTPKPHSIRCCSSTAT